MSLNDFLVSQKPFSDYVNPGEKVLSLYLSYIFILLCAGVAELADAQDLGSCGVTRGGSSPLPGIHYSTKNNFMK